jgi:hypothetical protein
LGCPNLGRGDTRGCQQQEPGGDGSCRCAVVLYDSINGAVGENTSYLRNRFHCSLLKASELKLYRFVVLARRSPGQDIMCANFRPFSGSSEIGISCRSSKVGAPPVLPAGFMIINFSEDASTDCHFLFESSSPINRGNLVLLRGFRPRGRFRRPWSWSYGRSAVKRTNHLVSLH